MYRHIIRDFLDGLVNSLKVGLIINPIPVEAPQKNTSNKHYEIHDDSKLVRLMQEMVKYNFLMHILPLFLVQMLNYFTGISLFGPFIIFNYLINLGSIFFHISRYMDLVNIVCVYSQRTINTMSLLDTITLTIAMFIYQTVIYLTVELVNFILHDRIYLLAIVLNFFILTIYHSFYCYNNLWQYKKIEIFHRIDMHEKLWPYYLGYGTIATIMYYYISSPYVLGLYNLYMTVIIAIPFLTEIRFPPKESLYPKINLIIFSHITALIFALIKYLTKILN